MLSIGATLALPDVLRRLGANPAKLLSECGLDIGLFDDPSNQISYAARGRLLAHCAERTGCQHLGLLVGQQANLHSLGLVGLLVRYSPDVGTALRNLVRFLHLFVRGATPTLDVDGGVAIFGYQIYQRGAQGNDQVGDGAVAVIFNIMRELCGPDWKPSEAWFVHRRPDDIDEFRRFFKVRLRFDADQNALVFSSAWLTRRLPDADPELRRVLQQQIDALDARFGDDFPEQVRSILRTAVLTGNAKADQVAALFSMPTRTFHRRLDNFGTGFQELLDETAYGVAQQILLDSGNGIGKVAALLDYADARSFIRAFRRWSGTTPARWRASQKALRKSIVARRGSKTPVPSGR